MSDYHEFCFHEALVLMFKKVNNSILLELQDVDLDEKKLRVLVTCVNIAQIETDAKVGGPNFMTDGDGEVLTLNLLHHRAELIVQWHNHVLHTHNIKFYYVDCEQITVDVISSELV